MEKVSILWPTLGSRTAKEHNRTSVTGRCSTESDERIKLIFGKDALLVFAPRILALCFKEFGLFG